MGLITDYSYALRHALVPFLRIRKAQYIFFTITISINALMPITVAWCVALFLDAIVEQDVLRIQNTLVFLIGAYAVSSLLEALNDYQSTRVNFDLDFDMTKIIKEKSISMDLASYEDPQFQNTLALVSSNTGKVQLFILGIPYVIRRVVSATGALVAVWQFGWWVSVGALMVVIPRLIVYGKYSRRGIGIWKKNAEDRRRYFLMGWYMGNKTSLVEMALCGNAGIFLKKMQDLYIAYYRDFKQLVHTRALLTFFASLPILVFIGGVLFWYFVRGGVLLSIGSISLFVMSLRIMMDGLDMVVVEIGSQFANMQYAKSLGEFLHTKPILNPVQGKKMMLRKTAPEVVFHGVGFAYPRQEKPVLHDINFSVKQGSRIAIVGLNGAGKSTLVKLFCRYYDPTAGSITVDGKELARYSQQSWHRYISCVFQDYPRYNFSVKECIGMGDLSKNMSMNSIESAAREAQAQEFIVAWKNGYNQMLGVEYEHGVEPSVGQWQKLAIARALYRDAPILILDEPTASVDAESEQKIFNSLERLPRTKTVILISHRFSTVRNADKILLVDGGTIAEQGTHDELMKLNGTYARLFTLQAKGYAQDAGVVQSY